MNRLPSPATQYPDTNNPDQKAGLVAYSSSDNSNPNSQTDLWRECLNQWLSSVERRRGSKRSAVEYEKSLRNFFTLAQKEPQSVTGSDAQKYVQILKEQGLAKTTINSRMGAVSSFYRFACTRFESAPGHYLHDFNPATSVQREHVNPYENSQGLSIEQARSMLNTCDRATGKGARDYALISFYLYTGRRRAEIARLTWQDLRTDQQATNKGKQMEYRYRGKGDKGGWRELPPPVWDALKTYLLLSGRYGNMTPTAPLFTTTKVVKISGSPEVVKLVLEEKAIADITVTQVVSRAAKLAGLEHVKVHALRHTAAKLRRKAGDTLEEVSQFLDHSSIATTQIYLGAIEAKKDKSWKSIESALKGEE